MIKMDVLQDMYVLLELGRRVIQFSRQPLRSCGWRIRLTAEDGTPACTLMIGSKEVEMRLVTGLKNNYVPEEIVGIASPLGEAEDVFPGLGVFTTGLYLGVLGEAPIGETGPQLRMVMVVGKAIGFSLAIFLKV